MPAYRTRDLPSRTLEVTTDAPLTPEVTIVSPTPRAFTFPISHDAPYASPSNSPFEPELKSCATPPPARPLSPTSSIGSETSSLLSTPSTTTSSHVSHRRRRSTVSENERRPKKGDEDYIKRPENAFILFRRKCCEDRQQALEEGEEGASAPVKKQRQADLSKMISQQWKGLSQEERQYWEDLAKEKKKEHEQMYPNYVYRPQRVKKSKKGKGRKDGEPDTEDSISFMMPVPTPHRSLSREHSYSHGHSRRAFSAPTPPPMYQAIQLPTVYMPSCPPSPTGVPRISRRASYIPPPTDSGPSTRFEYLPQGTILPPTLDAHSTYESNFSYDSSYQPIQFDNPNPFSGRPTAALSSLSIPPEQAHFHMLSPTESIASSLYSSGDAVSSAMSSSASSSGPFTPADSLSMNGLTISQSNRPDAKGVPEDIEDDISGAELGFGGYSTWSPEPLWPENGELIITDDFNLASIPPVELGMTMPESSSEAETPYGPISDEPFGEAPGQDPFASLFSYDGMNW
ncbi:hypothetical protein EIP86_008500 [Pleurotus ostreatoroseus]|nr:hypothetical protein EIP86_008500 [Pleurotus ostreatoroseus]